MGLYIPGGSSNGDDNSKKNSLLTDGSSKDSFTFHYRPNVGLKIWGPLVPASDYLPGLYGLTAFQAVVGLVMFRHVKNIWPLKSGLARVSKFLNGITGSYLIFNSGLEVSRLTLPYDPWYDEAKEARERAVAAGQRVNFWFGPWDFKPMSLQEWNQKVDAWILQQESNLENISAHDENLHPTLSFANKEFHAIHSKIRESNKQRSSQILQLLSNEESFREMLPNYQNFANMEFDRPNVRLPEANKLEDELDFIEAWELNDPWTALGQDTDYVVRFIPKFRWIEKIEENKRLIREAEDKVLKEQEKQYKALESDLDGEAKKSAA